MLRPILGGGPSARTRVPKGDRMATEAYCVKCRAKKTMKDEKAVTMKNGKPATQGICPDCGTKMFKIGKSK
jgi:RNase P subunit RPR2